MRVTLRPTDTSLPPAIAINSCTSQAGQEATSKVGAAVSWNKPNEPRKVFGRQVGFWAFAIRSYPLVTPESHLVPLPDSSHLRAGGYDAHHKMSLFAGRWLPMQVARRAANVGPERERPPRNLAGAFARPFPRPFYTNTHWRLRPD